jgi:23S rRNA (uridine2552-2'-O)-methyltransferase
MHADNWAIKAKRMGYRSRAVFKLEEILDKLHSHKTYKNVLDLGSAPGGWSQYISLMQPKTKIFAIDLLDMDPITGVTFIKDDIGNIDDINIINPFKGKFDLVISDIAPNLSGIKSVDDENIFELNLMSINIANKYSKDTNAVMIIKTFQNNNLKSLRKHMELLFKIVQTYKPAASKNKSAEIYLYGAR